jgi:KinB signaling pathway activation protein
LEEKKVTIRSWVRFFVHTLIIGGAISGVAGFIIRWDEFSFLFTNGEWREVFSVFAWLVGVGFTFSVISQMGFFAYLTIHQFGAGMFRSYWNPVQFLIILVVLFDLVYFRFEVFAEKGESLLPYFSLAILLLVASLVVAWLKVKQSNKKVFISALFFMVVLTVIEWLPVLQANEQSWMYLMVITLLPCNAFQLLALPKYSQRVKA